MPQTAIEKIVQRFAVGLAPGRVVHAGDFLGVRPRHVMTHDNTSAVIPKFKAIGATRIADPSQPVICLDHDVQNKSPENLAKYAKIEAFAREHGLAFFRAGDGIGHQIMAEEGFCHPGTVVVGSDSHSNLYGALATVGTPVVRTDAAAIWATGECWWQIPPTVKVTLNGRLQPGVSGKDVIIALIGLFAAGETLNCAIEFGGDGVASLSMDQRLTIANMTTEWGALVGFFPYDETLQRYLLSRAKVFRARGDQRPRLTTELVHGFSERMPELTGDPEALYLRELVLDLGNVAPHVAGPNEVDKITPLPEMATRRVAIQKAYLLSCVNSRLEDIAEAARVLRGKKVAAGVKMYLAAASASIEAESKRLGHWQVLLDAGAIPLPPGCGPCIGLGTGTLEPGEVGISATNRNFKGRMGSRDAACYLASPAVVAASAAAGFVTGPEELLRRAVKPMSVELREMGKRQRGAGTRERILSGFPERIEGGVLYLAKDNLNTDGIYGKEWTYQELAPGLMGEKAMLNYDPEFQSKAQPGDIVVGRQNFGTGSSREQAATALKFRGLQAVVATSFSQTYQRNAFNNGFLLIECPELVQRLEADRLAAGRNEPTLRMRGTIAIDFAESSLRYEGESYPIGPISPVAQEMIVAGGSEAVVARKLQEAGGVQP
jgi:homoaconitate hydratase